MKIKIISLLCLSLCFGPGSESQSESHEGPEFGQFYETGEGEALVLPFDQSMAPNITTTLYGHFLIGDWTVPDWEQIIFDESDKPDLTYLIRMNGYSTFIEKINKCTMNIVGKKLELQFTLRKTDVQGDENMLSTIILTLEPYILAIGVWDTNPNIIDEMIGASNMEIDSDYLENLSSINDLCDMDSYARETRLHGMHAYLSSKIADISNNSWRLEGPVVG